MAGEKEKEFYVVNKKASFTHGGRVYGPKDEISADIFSEADLKILVKAEKLITEAQAKTVFADEAEAAPPQQAVKPSGNTGKEKTLDEMNVEELKAYAAAKNITIDATKSKADIRTAIRAAETSPKTLDEMNLDELKNYAKEKNISTKNGPMFWQNMNRDELLAAIKTAEAEAKAGGGQ